ncbi:carbohydrate-binding module family 21 protein [Xylariaceae sp. FL1651]|nr:carbohydrate-binding module family 21 protein [Xylariaceae sp. FL1651]
MPYTPPSHRSPASSAPASPDVSRRSSFTSSTTTPTRPTLPRSASYLTKHRRTPSAATAPAAVPAFTNGSTPDITPPGTSDNLKGMATAHSSSVRQSPPPVADAQVMPPGAIISPPESSSEDEGATELEDRGREIENMKELKEAISAIPQCRVSSPNRTSPGDILLRASQIDELVEGPSRPTLGINTGTRKISHSRSNTDPHVYLSKSAEASVSTSEEGSDLDEPSKKPQMVRKKSGELVRPALRPASLRRPSSMPGTPTFSKAVHFDSHLEHVRHFLQVDRPLAVSAGSSPADNYESDTEYPFMTSEKAEPRSPPYEWEIVTNNPPANTTIRKSLPVRLERVWMSPDQKSLIGSIAVANLAFRKIVVCRFTFDYWKTTSEVGAEFHHEIRPRETETGHDRFQFSIKLSDIANLESKTLYFCIRYNVNGLEYWDNNDNVNFQVDFRKKFVPQNGKRGVQGASSRPANALPRSNRRPNPSTVPRPRSMPVGAMDEFGQDSKLVNFDQPIHEFLGESEPAGLRLKISKSTTSLPSDNLPGRLSTPSGVAFANRYDFGASLSAAKQAHKSSSPNQSPRTNDGLYMKAHKRATFSSSSPADVPRSQSTGPQFDSSLASQPAGPLASAVGPLISGADSPSSASIASASYEEILNKYCFFNGSKQSSPQLKDGTLRSSRYDGAEEHSARDTPSNNSSLTGSPSMIDRAYREALQYPSHQNLSSYFQNAYITASGASPSESPLHGPTVSGRSFNTSGAVTTPGKYHVSASTSPNGSVPERASYHTQHLQDRFPFISDSHAATAIRG